MKKIFDKARVKGSVRAISSKSEAHRLLISAALAEGETEIVSADTNADIDATAACLRSLGATVERTESGFLVRPITDIKKSATLFVNESGSTLRFMLPVAAALGVEATFEMRGRLPERPLSPLYELLSENGVTLSEMGKNPLRIKGRLTSGDYRIAANISSQYISGMLMALSVTEGKSTLRLDGGIESMPYIEMTLDALRRFGASIDFDSETKIFLIDGGRKLRSCGNLEVCGDYSNAAFFLASGALGEDSVTVEGLDPLTRQGDCEIIAILERMGAKVERDGFSVTVYPSRLRAVNIDASQIPDLVPIIATLASVAEGESVIYNASRLRLKESDRIESVCAMLSSLGADIRATEDGMTVRGVPSLVGGEVDSFNDHRIAMSAAIASLVCREAVVIDRFEAINKSYPAFCEQFIF